MKKIMILILAAGLLIGTGKKDLFAWIWIDAIAPQSTNPLFQNAINQARDQLLTQARAELTKYQSQRKLARGFADSSSYSSHVATQRGYQGYDVIAVTIGAMAGGKLPSLDFDYYKDIGKKLKNNGDIDAGAALIPLSLQVGLHLGKMNKKLDGIYLSAKFGWLEYSYWGYTVEGMNAGFTFNYQIFKKKKAGFQVFVWRGVSVGTGLNYQKYKVKFETSLNDELVSIPGYSFAEVYVKPSFEISVLTESYVIPLEITTSMRLIWVLNLTLGGGIDFAISESLIKAKGYSYAIINDPTNTIQATPGVLGAYGEQKGKGGTWYLPKLIGGIGFSFGPVVIDVPVTYYFVRGVNVGLSVGFEW